MNANIALLFFICATPSLVKAANLANTGFNVTSIRSTVFYVEWNDVGKKYEATSIVPTLPVDCPNQPPRTDQQSPNNIDAVWNGDPIKPSTSYRLCLLVENIPDDNENDYAVIRDVTSAPGPPSNVNIDFTNSSTFHITWIHNKPNETTNYRVTYSSDGSSMTKNTTDTTMTLLVDGLNSNTDYNVTVAALTSELKTASDESQVTVATTVPLQVNILSTGSTNSTSIPVQWETLTEGNIPITYNVNWTSAKGEEGSETSIDGNYTVLYNMKSNTDYNITVEATNKGGTGIPSNAESVTTKPEKANQPSNSSKPTNSTIYLQWNEVDEGNSTRNYTVKWNSTGNKRGMKEGIPTNSTMIEGLEANAEYNFTVTAVNAAGPGEASSPSTFTTVPGIPTHVTVDSDSQKPTTDVAFSWMNPSGGEALNEYLLEWWPIANITAKQSNTSPYEAGKDLYDYDITGLTPGESYSFNVQARNSAGTGQISIRQSTTDPEAVSNLKVVQDPENPTTTLNVTWSTPDGVGNNISVNCTRKDGQSRVSQKTSFESTSTSCVVEPGYNYTVSVAAVSKNKTSATQTNETNTKPATVNVTATSTSDTIVITWFPVEGFAEYIVIQSLNENSLQNYTLDGTSTEKVITGLTSQTNYTFSIFSKISNNEGEPEESEKTYFYQVTEASEGTGGIDAGLIAGIVAAVVVLILLLLGGLYIYKRSKQHGKERDLHVYQETNSLPPPLSNNNGRRVRISSFTSYMMKMQQDYNLKCKEEFEQMSNIGREQATNAASIEENRKKNRYKNIIPYDTTRVKLSVNNEAAGADYINASYVKGYKNKIEYIATQGPLPGTTGNFWRMVWEQNTRVIVMVTKLVEMSKTKCEHYWPYDSHPVTFNDITVELTSQLDGKDWISREIILMKGSQTRTIKHFQYVAWPDHDVPDTTEGLVRFVHYVRRKINEDAEKCGPNVVHCSAGVGRTGTFIAIDHLLQHLKCHVYVDIFTLVRDLRLQRMNMVQTEKQYMFLHKVVEEIANDCYDPYGGLEPDYENLNIRSDPLYMNTSGVYVNTGYGEE